MALLVAAIIKGALVSMLVGGLIKLGVKELTKNERASNFFGGAAAVFTLLILAGIISIVNVLEK